MLSRLEEGTPMVAMGWCLERGVTKLGSIGLNIPTEQTVMPHMKLKN